MLTRSELPENPVILAIRDPNGGQHSIVTERVRGAHIRMTCSCGRNRADGWCRHQIELLCLRYDEVVDRTEEVEVQFEDVVSGTSLADLADDLDLALIAYQSALDEMNSKRPVGLDAAQLHRVRDLASNLADSAAHLDSALNRFKKKLASWAL
jgi:hypothetical protein